MARLDLPDPFDVHELCRRIGASRGRPIRPCAIALSATGFCGLWLAARAVDYVCYEQDTSAHHQEHIILHELGHIMFGHGGAETLNQMFSHLSADTLRIMLARRHDAYSDDQEAEAETFAYLVWRKAEYHPPKDPPPDDPAGRLGRVLED
ncbi:MAG: hypothetical protein ACJ72N_03280 [Labedaea sp.]